MNSRSALLQALTRDELQEFAALLSIEVPDRRSKAPIVEALSALDDEDLAGALSTLTRARLKELCRALGLDDSGKDVRWDALPIHHSLFDRTALIVPAFGSVGEYRAICVALLYALSIMVRCRPSVWRRVQEGDQDHLRVLVEAYLAVVDRVLPEQFLERVSGQPVFAPQPGAW